MQIPLRLQQQGHILTIACLCLLACLSPLPFGSNRLWVQAPLLVLAGLAFLGALPRLRKNSVGPVASFLLFLLVLGTIQLLPLTPSLSSHLSPEANQIRQTTLGADSLGSTAPLSLAPGATRESLLFLLAVCLIFFACSSVEIGSRGETILLLAFCIAGSFEALYGLFETFTRNEQIWGQQKLHGIGMVTGTYINRNHFAGLLALIIPTTLGLALSLRGAKLPELSPAERALQHLGDPSFWKRTILLFACVVMILAVALSLSRGGILALAGGLLFFAVGIFKNRRARWIPVAGALVMLSALGWILAFGAENLVNRFEQGAATRPILWESTLRMSGDFPLLGVGLGAFAHVFPGYQTEEITRFSIHHAHSDWLELGVEMGLPVLLASLVILCWLFGRGIRTWIRDPARGSSWLLLGLLGAVLSTSLRAALGFDLHIPANAIYATIALALLSSRLRGPNLNVHPLAILLPCTVLILLLGPSESAREHAHRASNRIINLKNEYSNRARESAQALMGSEAPQKIVNALYQSIVASEKERTETVVLASVNDLRKAVEMCPADPRLHLRLAKSIARLNSVQLREEASLHAASARTMFPANALYSLDAALVLLRYDSNDIQAKSWMRETLDKHPSLAGRAARHGLALGAESCVRNSLPPESLSAWRALATEAIRGAYLDEALRALEHLTRLEEHPGIPNGPKQTSFEVRVHPEDRSAILCILSRGRHIGHLQATYRWERHLTPALISRPDQLQVVSPSQVHQLGPISNVRVQLRSIRSSTD